ncbi:hypothetical protein [Tahibacter amnicola]|uniref:Lipoprotein n=1 Tax=Tahibacter amnicola TaxID=2976241 RepID=A0ABY6BKJ7_9GAMM|nr:hypothetical protein [Tahibacter amnicola]UXI70534.1 hypothetical protein N4264_13110 [Tahibacter amnicola]
MEVRFVWRIVRVMVLAGLVGLAGCGRAIRGGPVSTLDQPANDTNPSFPLAGQELLAAQTPDIRNQILQRRLVLIDQLYEGYVAGLRRDKSVMDLATGLAGLALGVAGTLTDSVTAKTNYAAAGTLLTGGAAVIDQTLFYEQTVLALVAAMDANRAQVRLQIENGMRGNLQDYAGDNAFRDLQAYERAGTLLSAITYIHTTSKGIQSDAEAEIQQTRDIVQLTPQETDLKACTTRSLMSSNPKRTAPAMLTAANALNLSVSDANKDNATAIAAQLRQLNRDASAADVARINKALSDAGVLINCQP